MLLLAPETLILAILLGNPVAAPLFPPAQSLFAFAAGFLSIGIVGDTLALAAFCFWLAGLLSFAFEQRNLSSWIAIPTLLWVAGMLILPVRESMIPVSYFTPCAIIS